MGWLASSMELSVEISLDRNVSQPQWCCSCCLGFEMDMAYAIMPPLMTPFLLK